MICIVVIYVYLLLRLSVDMFFLDDIMVHMEKTVGAGWPCGCFRQRKMGVLKLMACLNGRGKEVEESRVV